MLVILRLLHSTTPISDQQDIQKIYFNKFAGAGVYTLQRQHEVGSSPQGSPCARHFMSHYAQHWASVSRCMCSAARLCSKCCVPSALQVCSFNKLLFPPETNLIFGPIDIPCQATVTASTTATNNTGGKGAFAYRGTK